MKNILILLLGIMLLTGCGNKNNSNDADVDLVDPNASKTENQNSGIDNADDEIIDKGVDNFDNIDEDTVSDNTNETAPDGLYFQIGSTYIQIGSTAAKVLESLGEENGYFEAESCAYQGMDKFYFYSGFELVVNEINGVDIVTGITIVDDSAVTPEGIRIGSNASDIEKSFDIPYEFSNGLYQFKDGCTLLSILTNDDAVISIEYLMNNEAE